MSACQIIATEDNSVSPLSSVDTCMAGLALLVTDDMNGTSLIDGSCVAVIPGTVPVSGISPHAVTIGKIHMPMA